MLDVIEFGISGRLRVQILRFGVVVAVGGSGVY